ncbi:MAG: hypothetical protein M5R36_26080 [Deltaproteobacteria bacterium]|nr:hypothetical protein [Deltaproteobacteria bacterium]
MRRILLLLAALGALTVACGSSGDDDDATESDDDSNDDDTASDDDGDDHGDDDTGDDDSIPVDDDTADFDLDLDVFEGDEDLYGIACGDETILILRDDGWHFVEVSGVDFYRCVATGPDAFYLVGRDDGGDWDVYSYDGATPVGLGLDGSLVWGYLAEQPLKFFSADLGYAGPYEYRDGAFSDLGFKYWDVLAENDGIVADEADGCLKHWGRRGLGPGPPPRPTPMNVRACPARFGGVSFLGGGGGGEPRGGSNETPRYLTHWNGAAWDYSLEVVEDNEEVYNSMKWKIEGPSAGFAYVVVSAGGRERRGFVLRSRSRPVVSGDGSFGAERGGRRGGLGRLRRRRQRSMDRRPLLRRKRYGRRRVGLHGTVSAPMARRRVPRMGSAGPGREGVRDIDVTRTD